MNDLVNFTYEGRKVRTFIKNGEPQWVAKDVAEVLGYPETSNPARLFAHVPDEWKGRYPIPTPGGSNRIAPLICEVNPIHTSSKARKSQDMLCLSEQGLYFFLGIIRLWSGQRYGRVRNRFVPLAACRICFVFPTLWDYRGMI